jgi:hypothetical protein
MGFPFGTKCQGKCGERIAPGERVIIGRVGYCDDMDGELEIVNYDEEDTPNESSGELFVAHPGCCMREKADAC